MSYGQAPRHPPEDIRSNLLNLVLAALKHNVISVQDLQDASHMVGSSGGGGGGGNNGGQYNPSEANGVAATNRWNGPGGSFGGGNNNFNGYGGGNRNRTGSGAPASKKRKMGDGDSGERYRGTLKGYSSRDAYGFLEHAALKERYGADVYIHKNVYEQVFPPLQVGEPVEFSIHLNSKNKPQACFVSRVENPMPNAQSW